MILAADSPHPLTIGYTFVDTFARWRRLILLGTAVYYSSGELYTPDYPFMTHQYTAPQLIGIAPLEDCYSGINGPLHDCQYAVVEFPLGLIPVVVARLFPNVSVAVVLERKYE